MAKPVCNISDTNFVGVQIDGDFAEVALEIVRAVKIQANVLHQVAAVLKASNVNIEALMKITGDGVFVGDSED